jgi:hypothetical protein
MNKLRVIMADIVGALTHIELMGKTREETTKEVERLTKRINSELSLVRERFAASTLITTMLCEVNSRKMCLAYQYKGKLYSTANNVPGMANTDYLHTLNMTSNQWDALPRFSVWISTGNVYDTL